VNLFVYFGETLSSTIQDFGKDNTWINLQVLEPMLMLSLDQISSCFKETKVFLNITRPSGGQMTIANSDWTQSLRLALDLAAKFGTTVAFRSQGHLEVVQVILDLITIQYRTQTGLSL
jgi:hypothetical protein